MTPAEVTEPGKYRWTWTVPRRQPASGTIRVEREPFETRLKTQNGIYLDEIATRWPGHVVTMEKVDE